MIAGVSTEFIPPGPQSFETPPIFDGVEWFTKPVLVATLSVIVIVWFFWGASRKAAVVPGKLQFAGEARLQLRPQLDRPRRDRQP